jgi:hypothetical protein
MSQQQIFERLVTDLREFRKLERAAVEKMESIAENCTAAEWEAATEAHRTCLGAVKTTAEQLGVVYY